MSKIFRSRFASSSIVAVLVVVLLISTFTAAVLYLSQTQMRSEETAVETTSRISERLRENLEAVLLSYDQGTATFRVSNTGEVPLTISHILLVNPDGSLSAFSLQSIKLLPFESRTFSVTLAGDIHRLGLQTERGNVFPVVVSGAVTQQAYTVTFYILDSAGNAVSGASIVFNGASYTHGQSASVAAGSYPLSTGAIPSGYNFNQWETSGGVSAASTTSTSTTAMVSGSGSITMRLAQAPFDFSVSVTPSSGSVAPGGSATATVTVTLVSGSPATVSLSASGLPSGATATFSPSSGTPTFTSTLIIATSPSTPAGTYTITITGTSGSLSHSTPYTLTVATATYTVTFTQTGLPSGTSWSVTFGGQMQSSTGSTITFTNIPAGTYSWSVSSPISGDSGVRYVASPSSGSMNVPSQTSQSITYTAEYQWIFSASGLGSDASGTVVTIDGVSYAYTSLPLTFWWGSGSTHSYSYQQYVGSTTSGKRYANHSPPSGSITVSSSGSVSPAYHAEYLLTTSVSPSGAGSISLSPSSPDGYYDSGTSVTATASAGTGYTFSKWQLNGVDYSTSNPVSVTMNAPNSLTAVFAGATYTLTVYVYRSGTTTGISGVTVRVDGTPYTTGSSGSVTVTVSYGSHTVEVVSPYIPSSGTRYVFTQWSDGSTSNPRTISITASTTLTAYMKLQHQLTVTVSPSGGGSVSASPSSPDGYYDYGTTVTLTATANSGYAFDAWTGDASGTGTSTTITMNAPKSATANFFTFSISVNPSSGSTSPGGIVTATVTVTYGSGVNSKSISLSASGLPSGSSASFSPSSVTISPSSATASSAMTITTSTSTPAGTYAITVTGSGGGLSKTATYMLTVTAATYTVSFYIYNDAGSSVSGATINFAGSSFGHGGSTSVPAGSYSLSTGTIPSGYRFLRWETSGSISVASSTSSSTTATVSGSGSITMRLQRIATVTFSASGLGSDASGTVLTVDGVSYSYGQLPLSFTWDVGSQHSFSWSDPVSAGSSKRYAWVSTSSLSTAKSGTITVPSGGGSITATYKTQYYLTMQVGSGSGSISPGSGWYDAGSSVQISATASSGYAFDQWVGSGAGSYTGTSSSAQITMNAPITETAYFFSFAISVSPGSGTVQQGGSVTATVTVTYSSGYNSKSISLSASGLPSGASASFSPSSVTISPTSTTATSTMTITTSSSTPTGTYTITVSGSGGGLSKSTTYTLTVNPSAVTVTFRAYFTKYGSSTAPSGSDVLLYVDGAGYTCSQLASGVSFSWAVGSTHSVSWTLDIYRDESSVISGLDTRYTWSYSTGIFTLRSGTLTVPSGGGTVTAYYSRYVYVTFGGYGGVYPSGSGSVSPSSPGYYPENTAFTASANYGYRFSHWTVQRGYDSQPWTSTYNPFYMSDPGGLAAVFNVRVQVFVYDSGYTPFPGIYVTLGSQSGYTNSYGAVEFYVPYSTTATLAVPSSGTGGGGRSLPFWTWSDGVTSSSRPITVTQPTSYTAQYWRVMYFSQVGVYEQPVGGETDLYTFYGYLYAAGATSTWPMSGASVRIQWWYGPSLRLDTTVTTNSNGYFATSAYGTAILPGWSTAYFRAYDITGYLNQAEERYPF